MRAPAASRDRTHRHGRGPAWASCPVPPFSPNTLPFPARPRARAPARGVGRGGKGRGGEGRGGAGGGSAAGEKGSGARRRRFPGPVRRDAAGGGGVLGAAAAGRRLLRQRGRQRRPRRGPWGRPRRGRPRPGEGGSPPLRLGPAGSGGGGGGGSGGGGRPAPGPAGGGAGSGRRRRVPRRQLDLRRPGLGHAAGLGRLLALPAGRHPPALTLVGGPGCARCSYRPATPGAEPPRG